MYVCMCVLITRKNETSTYNMLFQQKHIHIKNPHSKKTLYILLFYYYSRSTKSIICPAFTPHSSNTSSFLSSSSIHTCRGKRLTKRNVDSPPSVSSPKIDDTYTNKCDNVCILTSNLRLPMV
mmetsp:Transcript_2656/g.3646  ORF Transcript_2656/g.3646 Transcript_2656/m.3646 type:complete len:122 (+) Transcript_2656:306-671(+)